MYYLLSLASHALAVEIQHFQDFLAVGTLVDADIPYVGHQGEVDDARLVLLVVRHELIQLVVLLAVEGEDTLVLLYELQRLVELVVRESQTLGAEIKLAYQTPCNSVSVQDGAVFFKGQALQGVTGGMSQVQSLADTLLGGVFLYDTFLYGYALGYHLLQVGVVYVVQVEGDELGPVLRIADNAVLQHLGITGTDVIGIQSAQEVGTEDDGAGAVEDTYLVLQSAKVDACLASHAGIDHTQQCGGDIDVLNAALEGAGSKAAQVRNHAAAQADKQAVACGATLLQGLPDGRECLESLVLVGSTNGYHLGLLQIGIVFYEGPAELQGGGVGEDKELVMRTALNGLAQVFRKVLAYDYVLFHYHLLRSLYKIAAKIQKTLNIEH